MKWWFIFLPLSSVACQPEPSFDSKGYFKEHCSICHENVEMQRGPHIFGLNANYLESQSKSFKNGVRGTQEKNKSEILMGSVKDKIPEGDHLKQLVGWISKQKTGEFYDNLKGDAEAGKALAQACLACHHNTEGLPKPKLESLEAWYMLDQLRKYKRGWRGGHPEDFGGKLMQEVLGPYSDKDIKNIVVYIQTLRESE